MGGEGIVLRTPAVVNNNTMSHVGRVRYHLFGLSPKARKKTTKSYPLVSIMFNIVQTLSDRVDPEPAEADHTLPLAARKSRDCFQLDLVGLKSWSAMCGSLWRLLAWVFVWGFFCIGY